MQSFICKGDKTKKADIVGKYSNYPVLKYI